MLNLIHRRFRFNVRKNLYQLNPENSIRYLSLFLKKILTINIYYDKFTVIKLNLLNFKRRKL